MDAAAVRNQVIKHFQGLGMTSRDHSNSEYSWGGTIPEGGLRYKVGTKWEEVTITVWRGGHQVGVVRINKDDQIDGILVYLGHLATDAKEIEHA